MSIEQRGSGDGDTSYLTRVGRNSPAIKAFIGISTRTVSRRVLDRPGSAHTSHLAVAQGRAAVASLWRAAARVFLETYRTGRDVALAESGFALLITGARIATD
jgi:hypothetical protein